MNVRNVWLASGIVSSAAMVCALIGTTDGRAQSAANPNRTGNYSRSPYVSTTVVPPSTAQQSQSFPGTQQGQTIRYFASPRIILPNRVPHPQPIGGAIRQVQQVQTAPGQVNLSPQGNASQESAVQRELRKLYQQSGQNMPEMNINHLPRNSGANRQSAQGRDISRRTGGIPPKKSPLDFLKRLLPGRKKPKVVQQPKPQTQFRVREISPRPQVVNTPPQQQVGPVATQPAITPARPVTPRGIPVQAASQSRVITTVQPKAFPVPRQPVKKSAPPSVKTATDENELNPFPEQSEEEADRQKSQHVANGNNENPFTGKKLDEPPAPGKKTTPKSVARNVRPAQTPADNRGLTIQPRVAVKKPESTAPANTQSGTQARTVSTAKTNDVPPKPKSAEEKMRLISERRGMSGFRGFCPVTLRDKRDLADARIEFRSEFEGKVYYFASGEAKSKFDAAPHKYAPAKGGRDVIDLAGGSNTSEGSLEYAVWYRDRLYFFTSQSTLNTFVASPSKYAVTK